MTSTRVPAVLLLTFAVLAMGAPRAAAEDAPAAEAPAVDPVKQQMFADKEAEEALDLIEGGQITEVMEGLDRLSKIPSKKATAGVVTYALSCIELHVAEFAGHALARADPEGALDALEGVLQGGKKVNEREFIQAAGMLSELPAPRSVELLASDRLLRSRNEVVRREAIRALGWHRPLLGHPGQALTSLQLTHEVIDL